MSSNSNSDGVNLLIGIFLNHEFYVEVVEDVAEIISELIIQHTDTFMLGVKDNRKSFNIPYHKIADEIFNHNKPLEIESLENFVSAVDSVIHKKNNSDLKICFNKISRHILLAAIQRSFMSKSAESALLIAEKAEKDAKFAQKQAKKAKEMSNGMVTNFVTILGVFATIIITVFGGINIVSSTVKLLEGNNKLVYLVFVVSFLMICLLTLIKLLMSWINSIKVNNDDQQETVSLNWKKVDFYTISVGCFLSTVIASGVCIVWTKKDQDIKPKLEESQLSSQKSETKDLNPLVVKTQ